MRSLFLRSICLLSLGSCTLVLTGCERGQIDDVIVGSYLYLGTEAPGQYQRYGDILTYGPGKLDVIGSFTGRDTILRSASIDPRSDPESWFELGGGPTLTEDYLTARPFVYRIDSAAYWASFEPSFTGFPEFARAGAKDFINRMAEWEGVAPGLEYTEYVLRQVSGQSILLISERQRGRYVNSFAVVVDTLHDGGFEGMLIRQGRIDSPATNRRIRFDRAPGSKTDRSVANFVDLVNEGFSRSYLLFPPNPIPDSEMSKAGQRLPRRALIDADDPGRISASFLEDGTFMLLTDDQVALEGNYTLDLDKGILTVDDGKSTTFRIFVNTQPKISFTLPVSVLSLSGTKMVGTDNYLRIEVVQP